MRVFFFGAGYCARRLIAREPWIEASGTARSAEGVAASMDCRLHATHEAGDHLIFIGEVLEIGTREDGTPLVFHGGGYRLLTTPPGA